MITSQKKLNDESISGMSNIDYAYPKQTKLLSNEKIKCRKIPYVLQYYVPNKETSPEEYAHHMLFMYYPFRNEKELLSGNPPTYVSKLSKNGMIEVVNQNYSLAEPFATIVDDAFLRINCDNVTNMDPYGHQEKDEVTDKIVDFSDNSDIDTLETTKSQSADLGNTNAFTNLLRVVPGDNVINKNIRSLNMQQREIFNFLHKWLRDFIKSLGCKIHQNVKPFYTFITDGAGVRKSHLIKSIYMLLSKVLMYKGGELKKPRVLLLAPTGVAAININGTTIHSALGTNIGGKLYPLSEQHRAALRNNLSEVRLIVIDEISMVSSVLLFQVNQQLNEIFRYSGKEPIAGPPVIVCGDFYQLPPVKI